jgi:hypothetical protein
MLHPLAKKCPTEISELWTKPGNTFAFLACMGKSVRNKSHVCDDWIDVPLGMFELSGICASCLMVHGVVDVADKKYVCTHNIILLCHILLSLKVLGYSLKLMQVYLAYDL